MKPEAWDHLKNITVEKVVRSLIKDGWAERRSRGSTKVFTKGERMVSIHYHPGKTYGARLLQDLLNDIGWTEKDPQRLKLIK